MNRQTITNGGLQDVPRIAAAQIVYLDFDGELTSYNGEILTVDDVIVEDSGLTRERIQQITAALNEQFAGQNVVFVSDKSDLPDESDYSTVYVGKTSSFEKYGTFAGLAETIDSGNQIKNDNAFVILNSTADNARIIETIAHETSHLLGTLNHGGEGLLKYAKNSYYISSGVTSTGIVLGNGSMHVSSGGVANSTTINSYGYLYVSSGGMVNDTTLQSGLMFVSKGGVANNTTANFGYMYISGTANNTIFYGGWITDYGEMNSTTISAGNLLVTSDGTANSTTINSGGNMGVTSDGTANSTTINSGGNMGVTSDGIANYTIVNSGANIRVSCGGTANYATINSNGNIWVYSGGIALNVTNSGNAGGDVLGGDTATVLKGTNADGKEFYISNGVASNISGSLDI